MQLHAINLQRFIIVILFLLGFSACKSGTEPAPATLAPTIVHNTRTPTTVPPTATPEPTSTTVPNPCPSAKILSPPEKKAFDGFPEQVLNYLQEGGNPNDIELVDREIYFPADLTGDYVKEHIFVFIDAASVSFPPKSTLVIYQCRERTVNILTAFDSKELQSIQLIDAQDMTQNSILDLVFSEVTCGAHTCWHTLHVLTWTGTNFTDSVGGEFSYPYPNYFFADNQLYITSFGIASAGAGPQRQITTTLAWDGSVVTTTSTTTAPAVLRFHAFVDGDNAYQMGQLTRAQEFYHRVIEDSELESWGGLYSVDDENEWLNALAHWRIINLSTQMGDMDSAEIVYTALNESVPFSSPVYPVILLSQRYWQGIEAGNTISHTCGVIQAMPETLLILDFLNSFGYANPYYKAKDMCYSLP